MVQECTFMINYYIDWKKKEINIDIKIIKFDSNKNKNFLTPDALGCTLFKS